MYHHKRIPMEWFQPGPSYHSPPMSRPVSKNFNRISDFIFPDTVHLTFPAPPPYCHHRPPPIHRYHRTDNYSLPVLNRRSHHQRDMIIVERLPAEEFNNVDLLYREQSHRPAQRRYSSIIDERRIPMNDRNSTRLANRTAAYRERVRDRRKRHTTDNAYHSILKSMLDEDGQQKSTTGKDSKYILSYRTALDPITDSESMTSIHEQENNRAHYRVPINGTAPMRSEHERQRQRQHSSSISSRDSSSDTEITERRPITMNQTDYQQNSSIRTAPTVWKRLPSKSVYQPDQYIPINSSSADTNNHQTISHSNNLINPSPFDNVINNQINNLTSAGDSTHHVSLCVNDLRTTLFIDEDTLNNTKNINNGGKTVIKTFVDRIIKRLQHFKRSLDHGLIHVRKRNAIMNESIITAENEVTKQRTSIDDNKLARPYFLIRPQTILMLPNETAKFKCCFGGDPFPALVWSHNQSRIPEIIATGGPPSMRYQTHKLHDIHYLDIGPVHLSDNGQIKCTLMNRLGREEAIAQLLVVPSPADGTPRITQSLNDMTIVKGRPLKLSCSINGLQVTVNWFHNGKLISPMTPMKSDYNDETTIFTLSCCLKSDGGTVDCLVKNRFGEARSTCRIEVIDDPAFDR